MNASGYNIRKFEHLKFECYVLIQQYKFHSNILPTSIATKAYRGALCSEYCLYDIFNVNAYQLNISAFDIYGNNNANTLT